MSLRCCPETPGVAIAIECPLILSTPGALRSRLAVGGAEAESKADSVRQWLWALYDHTHDDSMTEEEGDEEEAANGHEMNEPRKNAPTASKEQPMHDHSPWMFTIVDAVDTMKRGGEHEHRVRNSCFRTDCARFLLRVQRNRHNNEKNDIVHSELVGRLPYKVEFNHPTDAIYVPPQQHEQEQTTATTDNEGQAQAQAPLCILPQMFCSHRLPKEYRLHSTIRKPSSSNQSKSGTTVAAVTGSASASASSSTQTPTEVQ